MAFALFNKKSQKRFPPLWETKNRLLVSGDWKLRKITAQNKKKQQWMSNQLMVDWSLNFYKMMKICFVLWYANVCVCVYMFIHMLMYSYIWCVLPCTFSHNISSLRSDDVKWCCCFSFLSLVATCDRIENSNSIVSKTEIL